MPPIRTVTIIVMMSATLMISGFLDDFVVRACVAGIGLTFLTGPIGCILLWRRMAFFGDALGHAALLGVALAAILQVDFYLGIIAVCLVSASLLGLVRSRSRLTVDAWLAIVSYTALALGIIALSKAPHIRIDPSSYLFGDILTLNNQDLAWIFGCVLVVIPFFVLQRRRLLLLTLDEELAKVAGVPTDRLRIIFMVILAMTVAVCLKTVGALLLPALLIIPAASAGRLAKSPEQMIVFAVGIGALSITGGLWSSIYLNTPSGPTIVLSCTCLFLLINVLSKLKWRE